MNPVNRITLMSLTSLSLFAQADEMILKDNYNLRATSSGRGKIIHTNQREQRVFVTDQKKNNYVLICLGGDTKSCTGEKVWVHHSGLKDTPDLTPTLPPIPGETYYATVREAPVRSLPGTKGDSKIIDYIPKGTPLTFVEQHPDVDGDTWYLVSYKDGGQNLQGYIFEGRLQRENPAVTEGQACQGGPDCQGTPSPSDPITIAELLTGDAKGFRLGSSFHQQCSNFIDGNGLGTWGRTMINAIKKVGAQNCFYNKNIFKDFCPKYNSLNESKKNAVIAIIFASMAEDESDCKLTARNYNGTNCVADGLFQMEKARSQRADAGRNSKWCKTKQSVDTQALGFQSECTVSIINDTVCKKGRQINYSGGYWEQLRGKNRRIGNLIKKSLRSLGGC